MLLHTVNVSERRGLQYRRNRHLAHISVSVRMICNMYLGGGGAYFSSEAPHLCETHVYAGRQQILSTPPLCGWNCVWTAKRKEIDIARWIWEKCNFCCQSWERCEITQFLINKHTRRHERQGTNGRMFFGKVWGAHGSTSLQITRQSYQTVRRHFTEDGLVCWPVIQHFKQDNAIASAFS